jgi:hypothetical protein
MQIINEKSLYASELFPVYTEGTTYAVMSRL